MAKATTADKTHTITMKQNKVCKNSIRYESPDPNVPADNLYLAKNAFDPMPDEIVVTIAPKK